MAKPKHPGGRPTEYDPATLPLIAEACARGATDFELAELLGVTSRTIYRWRAKYPEFGRIQRIGKELADERVERGLYQRAVGYSFESEKIITVSDGKDAGSRIERVDIVEHIPPDVTAAIFWLKNRRRDLWRDKQELEHSGPGGGAIPLEGRFELGQAMAFALRKAARTPAAPAAPAEDNMEDLA